MPAANLTLESTPGSFNSFFAQAIDSKTNMRIIVASADQYARIKAETLGLPGIYVLQSGDSTVYVGQSKDLSTRLSTHRSKKKIGYTKVMVMVRDQSLSMHLDYAEAKLYVMLQDCGFKLDQMELGTGLDVKRKRLAGISREYLGIADELLAHFLTYCVALGLAPPIATKQELATVELPINNAPVQQEQLQPPALEPLSEQKIEDIPIADVEVLNPTYPLKLFCNRSGIRATGLYGADGSVTVLKGSIIKEAIVASAPLATIQQRNEFLAKGTLAPMKNSKEWQTGRDQTTGPERTQDEDLLLVTVDIEFKSASAAAALCTGASVNGWAEWKLEDGKALDSIRPK